MLNDTEVDFKDFTVKRKRIIFRVDPDAFECAPALSPEALQEIVTKFRADDLRDAIKERNIDATMTAIRDIFGIFLIDDDANDRFVARLADRRNPIDIHQLLEIVEWIIQKYTKRPTEPLPDSLDGSPSGNGGIDSTAGVSQEDVDLLNYIRQSS